MEAFFYVILLLVPFCTEIFCLEQNYAVKTGNKITGNLRDRPNQSKLANNQVFKAVWNVPRDDCKTKFGVDLGLKSYGILTNAEGTTHSGDVMTIFYNKALGLYPFIEIVDGEVTKINAGLPQVNYANFEFFLYRHCS